MRLPSCFEKTRGLSSRASYWNGCSRILHNRPVRSGYDFNSALPQVVILFSCLCGWPVSPYWLCILHIYLPASGHTTRTLGAHAIQYDSIRTQVSAVFETVLRGPRYAKGRLPNRENRNVRFDRSCHFFVDTLMIARGRNQILVVQCLG